MEEAGQQPMRLLVSIIGLTSVILAPKTLTIIAASAFMESRDQQVTDSSVRVK